MNLNTRRDHLIIIYFVSVQEVQQEGKIAIDSPGSPNAPVIPPEDYNLEDNESRSIVQQASLEHPHFRELLQVLIDWINDELVEERIIVTNIEEDLYDGQVLQKLFEKLTGHKLNVAEVTQSAEGQRQKLAVVLNAVNHVSSTKNIVLRALFLTQCQSRKTKSVAPCVTIPI